jgi:hypothetical protein
MQNLSTFQISNITTPTNEKHFILIHSKIFSIIGILLIPILLICLATSYYFYKRYLNTKLRQERKQGDQTSTINPTDDDESTFI